MAHLEVYWVVAGMHWKPCISWCGFLFFCFCCIFWCKFHVGGVNQLLYADSKCLVSLSITIRSVYASALTKIIWISHGWRGVFVVSTGFVQFHSPTLPVEIWHFNKQTTRYKSQDANTKLVTRINKSSEAILVADGMVLLLRHSWHIKWQAGVCKS